MTESSERTAAPTTARRPWDARIPIDLVGVGGFALVSALVLVVWNPSSPLVRGLFGLPLLFLAPGYAVISLLYPRSVTGESSGATIVAGELSDVERTALSFGLSFALLPMLGLVIATVGSFSPPVVVTSVSGFVLAVTLCATVRRFRVPAHERYRINAVGRLAAFRSWLFPGGAPLQTAVNLALAGSVLLALLTGGYAFLAPQDGEEYTTLQLLTEDETGELVAAGYPDQLESGEGFPLAVAVENQEGESMEYTLVVQQQRLVDGEVIERQELDRIDYHVDDGSTSYEDRTFEPTAAEGEIRMVFLLYEDGEVPDTPTTDNAYRYGHLWIDVGPAED